jgi:hypothetical protein
MALDSDHLTTRTLKSNMEAGLRGGMEFKGLSSLH